MEESQKQLEEIKKALSDNDTHIQLSNLERRWQVVSPTIILIITAVTLVIDNKIMSFHSDEADLKMTAGGRAEQFCHQ